MTPSLGSVGGQLLRGLRKRRGLVQLDVELEAGLGTGYLQRLELGKVRQPTRAVLDRLLEALRATYAERRSILESFGYVVTTDLPSDHECAWAVGQARDALREAPFPSYLLDCALRLLACGEQVPLLLGLARRPGRAQRLTGRSLIDVVFDPAWGVFALVRNPDDFFPLFVQILRRDSQPYQGEGWYQALIADALLRLPLFRRYWELGEARLRTGAVARPHVPLQIASPDGAPLQFRITADPLYDDPRFRIVSYVPLDEATLRQCARWHSALARTGA